MQPRQAGLDHLVIPPADQPVGRGAVKEIMFASTLPDKVPAVLGVDANGPAPSAASGMESAGAGPVRPALAILHRVRVVSRPRRHESNPVRASIFGVREPVHVPALVTRLERPANRGV